MFDVVALGELLIDFSPISSDDDGFPTLKANPGGAPGNFLAALSRYGARTAFIGKVGQDAFGQLLLHTLERAGIDTRGVLTDPSAFTTLAFVTLDERGERSFSFSRKPGADTLLRPDEVDLGLIGQCRLFHFGTLSLTAEPARSATRLAVAHAKAAGKIISCDPNLRLPLWDSPSRAREEMLWAVHQADIVKISEDEVDFLWACSPETGADRLLEECGVSLAMVTLGPAGCYVKNRQGACYGKCPDVRVRDTTGAGDIFGGAAVSRWLTSGTAPELLRPQALSDLAAFSCAAASLSTQYPGGIPSIPAPETVYKLLLAQSPLAGS